MRLWLLTLASIGCCMACGATSEMDVADCENCGPEEQAFRCQEDVPQQSPLPLASLSPAQRTSDADGSLEDGTYGTIEVRFLGEFASVPGETLELRDGYYHRNHTTYSARTGEAMTGFEETGAFTVDGGQVTFEGSACVAGNPDAVGTWSYWVTDTGFNLLKESGSLSWVEVYERLY